MLRDTSISPCRRQWSINAGDDLLSRWTHYHRPRVLNGRVRDGNGCGHPGMVTGKSCVDSIGQSASVTIGRDNVASKSSALRRVTRVEGGDNAAKRSAVSTGQLSALPHLHARPIDLVVYREPSLARET